MKTFFLTTVVAACCSFAFTPDHDGGDQSDWIVTTAMKVDGPVSPYGSCENRMVVRYTAGGDYTVQVEIKNTSGYYQGGYVASKKPYDATTYVLYNTVNTCTYEFLDMN